MRGAIKNEKWIHLAEMRHEPDVLAGGGHPMFLAEQERLSAERLYSFRCGERYASAFVNKQRDRFPPFLSRTIHA